MADFINWWHLNVQFLGDLFDCEVEGEEEEGNNDNHKDSKNEQVLVCALPMGFFSALPAAVDVGITYQAEGTSCGTVGTIAATCEALAVHTRLVVPAGDLQDDAWLFKRIVAPLFVQAALHQHHHMHHERFVRDFTYPVMDARHWGLPSLADFSSLSLASPSSTSSSSSTFLSSPGEEDVPVHQ